MRTRGILSIDGPINKRTAVTLAQTYSNIDSWLGNKLVVVEWVRGTERDFHSEKKFNDQSRGNRRCFHSCSSFLFSTVKRHGGAKGKPKKRIIQVDD